MAPNEDIFDVLPVSVLHTPILSWEAIATPGKAPGHNWQYILGFADDPTIIDQCYYEDRAQRRFPLDQVSPANPIDIQTRLVLVAPRPVKVTVGVMEPNMCRIADTLRMYGGKIVLEPVAYTTVA